MTDLADLARDLNYAATSGGSQLGARLAAQARTELEIGAAVAVPGPGLAAIAKRRGTTASVSAAAPAELAEQVASRTAVAAAQDGAELALGKIRR